RTDFNPPSRFIDEIPPTLLRNDHSRQFRRQNNMHGYFLKTPAAFAQNDKDNYSPIDSPIIIEDKVRAIQRDSAFKINENVRHRTYGHGTIVNIEGSGDNTKLTVAFGSKKKVFIEKYTPLEKI
ncbi:MAG: hypothetical protein FWG92_02830, partial [Leptospirales bacterium]|nr:hypothetical protein [Leptospirales bacterium]